MKETHEPMVKETTDALQVSQKLEHFAEKYAKLDSYGDMDELIDNTDTEILQMLHEALEVARYVGGLDMRQKTFNVCASAEIKKRQEAIA